MALEEGMLRKIGVSLLAVGLFVALVVSIGVVYGGTAGFSGAAGLALVGSIVLFILVMGAVGIWLAQ